MRWTCPENVLKYARVYGILHHLVLSAKSAYNCWLGMRMLAPRVTPLLSSPVLSSHQLIFPLVWEHTRSLTPSQSHFYENSNHEAFIRKSHGSLHSSTICKKLLTQTSFLPFHVTWYSDSKRPKTTHFYTPIALMKPCLYLYGYWYTCHQDQAFHCKQYTNGTNNCNKNSCWRCCWSK